MRARKLPNGEIACVLSSLRFVQLDGSGRLLRSFPVQVTTQGGRIDVLPDGRVLVPEFEHDRVVEYDGRGQAVHEIAFRKPVAAIRLANGHTLITSYQEDRGAIELDQGGNEVWEYRLNTPITRAFRR
jgi:hypothetical protein